MVRTISQNSISPVPTGTTPRTTPSPLPSSNRTSPAPSPLPSPSPIPPAVAGSELRAYTIPQEEMLPRFRASVGLYPAGYLPQGGFLQAAPSRMPLLGRATPPSQQVQISRAPCTCPECLSRSLPSTPTPSRFEPPASARSSPSSANSSSAASPDAFTDRKESTREKFSDEELESLGLNEDQLKSTKQLLEKVYD